MSALTTHELSQVVEAQAFGIPEVKSNFGSWIAPFRPAGSYFFVEAPATAPASGGAVISMAQIAAGLMYIEARK